VFYHRSVRIKYETLRNKLVVLLINKRRFYCSDCKKSFTEPISGIGKGQRTTERLGRQYAGRRKTFMIFPEFKHIMIAPLIQFIELHMIVLNFAVESGCTRFRQSSGLTSIHFENPKAGRPHTRPS
jgi:hypothetical protein